MKFSPATDFGRIKIVFNPECKIAYTLWSKNIFRRFSLRKIPAKIPAKEDEWGWNIWSRNNGIDKRQPVNARSFLLCEMNSLVPDV
jgi:hypothetical protein